ncbi:hypothetical protein ACFX15_018444 [Malus domestica]
MCLASSAITPPGPIRPASKAASRDLLSSSALIFWQRISPASDLPPLPFRVEEARGLLGEDAVSTTSSFPRAILSSPLRRLRSLVCARSPVPESKNERELLRFPFPSSFRSLHHLPSLFLPPLDPTEALLRELDSRGFPRKSVSASNPRYAGVSSISPLPSPSVLRSNCSSLQTRVACPNIPQMRQYLGRNSYLKSVDAQNQRRLWYNRKCQVL